MQLVTGRRNCRCNLILHHLEQEAKDYWGCQVPKRIGFFFKEYKAHCVLGQKASNQCVRLKIQESGDKMQEEREWSRVKITNGRISFGEKGEHFQMRP